MSRSYACLSRLIPEVGPTISWTIFFTVALGRERSSSVCVEVVSQMRERQAAGLLGNSRSDILDWWVSWFVGAFCGGLVMRCSFLFWYESVGYEMVEL